VSTNENDALDIVSFRFFAELEDQISSLHGYKIGIQQRRTSVQYTDESDSLQHMNGDPCDQKAAGVNPSWASA
jgi:hypothetical protein